ncbi:hypothetical protein B9G69_005645 [Bdellovibrio sp. SKB1291214]|uniref:hypothetical protein n=1 Tax=Bdellovibrio sp. SKB1291214 TaxID=1732569 RepID=UPI000B518D0A|nr:hypothetical protein [Bdellovibrio sp. SKB1291214]UYL10059.1 hypothetical protein B9G69_005645 [Bdellovibrio sp. SKB1291214]
MNIKGLIPNIQPSDVKSIDRTGRAIQSDSAHDRDGNGQEAYQQQQDQKPPMTPEQLEASMEHLRKLPAFKEHRWTVELEDIGGENFVMVRDNLGTLIRKIPESELWTLPSDDSPRGQLLKRSA